jgi:peptidoglycan/LPS O-acetylase OafA/YrhL
LVPAYYAALALVLLTWPTDPTLGDTLVHFAFLQSFVPFLSAYDPAYWSLTPEIVFYALLPLLILKIRGLYQRLALFGALIIISMTSKGLSHASTAIIPETALSRNYHFPLNYLWLFVAGVLLRMLVEHLNEKRSGGSWPTLAFLLFVSSSTIFALSPYVSILKGPDHFRKGLVILFFTAALLGSPVLSWILARRPLAFVGEISYSLFLLHNSVLLLAKTYAFPLLKKQSALLEGAAVWLTFAGYAGTVLIVAGALSYLSYRYIESPFLRIKPK